MHSDSTTHGPLVLQSMLRLTGRTTDQLVIRPRPNQTYWTSDNGYLLPPRPSQRMSAVRSMSGGIARVRNGNSGSGPAFGFSIRRSEIVHCSELTKLGPGCYETQIVSEEVPDDAVRCSRLVVSGDCVRVFSRRCLRKLDIAAQKSLSNASIGVFARNLSGNFTPYAALSASMSVRIPTRLIARFML